MPRYLFLNYKNFFCQDGPQSQLCGNQDGDQELRVSAVRMYGTLGNYCAHDGDCTALGSVCKETGLFSYMCYLFFL